MDIAVCSHTAASLIVDQPGQDGTQPVGTQVNARRRRVCPQCTNQGGLRKLYTAQNVLKAAHLAGLSIAMIFCFFPQRLLSFLHVHSFEGEAATALYQVMGLLGSQILAISSIRGAMARGKRRLHEIPAHEKPAADTKCNVLRCNSSPSAVRRRPLCGN